MLAISAGLLVGGTVLIGVVPAVASTPQVTKVKADKSCIEHTYIEKLGTYYPGVTTANEIGTYGTYHDPILDSSGTTQLGTGVGTLDVLYKRPSDGHIIEYTTEQYQFADGTVVVSDYFDRTNLLAFKWVSESAKGTSGAYLGMSGKVTSRVISFTAPGYPALDKFILCK